MCAAERTRCCGHHVRAPAYCVCRRVLALKELQESYDTTSRSYQLELAQLQNKYLQKCGERVLQQGRSLHAREQKG